MSPRRIVFILIALLASGTTIFVGRTWLEGQRNAQVAQAPQEQPAQPATQILVASGDLGVGDFVRPENMRWQSWPNDGVAKTYVVSGQRPMEDFIGAVVRTSLSDGEPITEDRVVRPGDRGFLAAVLQPGYRAISIPISAAAGLNGLAFPGDHVDVLLTMSVTEDATDNPNPKSHQVSETILSDVRVLAMDQKSDDKTKDGTIPKTATLEVTPKQAEVVALVTEMGKLSLTLRSLARDAVETSDSGDSRLSYTFDSDATQLVRPPVFAGSQRKVNVIRGDAETKLTFPRSAE
jgi:pilus assembly protein CpaB